MFRLLIAVSFTLALASLCFFAASCGSSGQAQARVVQAISDAQVGLDVKVNTTTPFTNLAFGTVQPTPPAYTKVPSGTVTLQAVDTGTSTLVIQNTNATFNGSSQYTVLMTGFSNNSGTTAPTFWNITDNNTAPTAGNVEFRIINASTNSVLQDAGKLDIYIVQPGQGLGSATVSGLSFGQASAYIPENYNGAQGYQIYVCPPGGNQNCYFNNNSAPPTGAIRTLVIVDSGNFISNFLVLNDLG